MKYERYDHTAVEKKMAEQVGAGRRVPCGAEHG